MSRSRHGDLHMRPKSRLAVASMHRRRAFLLVGLLLFNTLALGLSGAEVSGRGGTNDDFTVTSITIGNASKPANTWIQPDGATQAYVFMGDNIEVKVKVTRLGNAAFAVTAPVTLSVVHPIGYVLESWSWETPALIGSAADEHTLVWSPEVAHSILNTSTNELHGGLVLTASVAFAQDTKNDNDVREQPVPVAVQSDVMDGTVQATDRLSFIPGRYPITGGGATGGGSWTIAGTDASNSAVGSAHWRHSQPSSNYPSNAYDRLIRMYFPSAGNCGSEGSLDGELSNLYQTYVCKHTFYAGQYVSTQFFVKAYGQTNLGDSVALEMWRPPGQYNDPMQSLHWNLSLGSPSTSEWSNLSWDPQADWAQIPGLTNPNIFLGGNSWYYGLLFQSDSSGASEGMHVDRFIQFGVSKVTEFTLDINCDNPEAGYSTPPNGVLSLKCEVTNNGYVPAPVRVFTNVSNESWMSPILQIRIDADLNPVDHDNSVILQGFDAGTTTNVWLNLSVPPGADVQQQQWNVTFYDHSSGESKGMISIPIGVTEQHSVMLTSTSGLVAAELMPGASGLVPIRLQNTGNRDAAFALTTVFSDQGWTAVVENQTGSPVPMPIAMGKGDAMDLKLNVTASSDASPTTEDDITSFNLRATCPTCGGGLFGTDVLVRTVEVPVLRDLSLTPDADSISGPANGQAQMVYMTLLNLGNDDEQYTLTLQQSNWMLHAELLQEETPVLDAWDGETTVGLRFPMPVGLQPGFYTATVTARSVDDLTVGQSVQVQVEVLDTAAVFVYDEDADQSYIPGDPAQSMEFEIRNDGNRPDSFDVTLDLPEGMVATLSNVSQAGRTAEVLPGESCFVIVSFAFTEGTEGSLTLGVVATSVNDPEVSATGNAVYLVGSQNWLRIPTVLPSEVRDAEDIHTMTVKVRNQYTTAQAVAMELDAGEAANYMQLRIDSQDRNFVLQVGEERDVTIHLDVSANTLRNLASDQLTVNFTVWARSETVSDAANAQLTVTMYKTVPTAVDGSEDDARSGAVKNVVMLGLAGIILVGGVVMVMRIIGGIEDDVLNDWADGGYEDSLQATYAGVKAAPTIPGVDGAPSTMPPAGAPPAQAAASAPVVIEAPAAPPVPPEGLPEGWTMDQWQVYGQMWLEQNGRA